MLTIPTTKGKVAIVGSEDYDFLLQWPWAFVSGRYAARQRRVVDLDFLKDEYNAEKLWRSPEGSEPTESRVQKFVVHVESVPHFNATPLKED